MASGRQAFVGGFGMGAEACFFRSFSKDSRSNGVGWGGFARLRERVAERGLCTGREVVLQILVFNTGCIKVAHIHGLGHVAITA